MITTRLVRSFKRQVSDDALIALCGWPTLAEIEPPVGTKCEWIVIHDEWELKGTGVWGQWPHQVPVTDPQITYWRTVLP